MIAWILLAVAGIGTVIGWFGLAGPIGHGDWPNSDRAACLQTVKSIQPDKSTALSIMALADSTTLARLDDLWQQLGFRPADTTQFLKQGGKLFTPTPATDTTKMLADLVRFETYRESVDTLIQNAYLGYRGLRIDRDCMAKRYAAGDLRISVLTWLAGTLLVTLPFLGLWMTWTWFGGRAPKTKVEP